MRMPPCGQKVVPDDMHFGRIAVVCDHFSAERGVVRGSGGGYQSHIDGDRPISLDPDDLACDAANSPQVGLDCL